MAENKLSSTPGILRATDRYSNPYEEYYANNINNPRFLSGAFNEYYRSGKAPTIMAIQDDIYKLSPEIYNQYEKQFLRFFDNDEQKLGFLANELYNDDTEVKTFEDPYVDEYGQEKVETFTGTEKAHNRKMFENLVTAKKSQLELEAKEAAKEAWRTNNTALAFLADAGVVASTALSIPFEAWNMVWDLVGIPARLIGATVDSQSGKDWGEAYKYWASEYYSASPARKARQDINEYFSDYSDLVDIYGNYKSLVSKIDGIFGSFGRMLPSIALTYAGVPGPVTQGLFYASAASQRIGEMASQPQFKDTDFWKISTNAYATSAAEWAIEFALGKLVGTSAFDRAALGYHDAAIRENAQITWKNALSRMLKDALHEGLEEWTQDYSTYFITGLYGYLDEAFNIDNKYGLQEQFDAFILGFFGSLFSTGMMMAGRRIAGGYKGGVQGFLADWEFSQVYEDLMNQANDILEGKNKANTKGQSYSLKARKLNNIMFTTQVLNDYIASIGAERSKNAIDLLDSIKSYMNDKGNLSWTELNERTDSLVDDVFQTVLDIGQIREQRMEEIKQGHPTFKDKLGEVFHRRNVTKVDRTESLKTIQSSDNEEDVKLREIMENTGAQTVSVVDGNGSDIAENHLVVNKQQLKNRDAKIITKEIAQREAIDRITSSKRFIAIQGPLEEIYKQLFPKDEHPNAERIAMAVLYNSNMQAAMLAERTQEMYELISTVDKLISSDEFVKNKHGQNAAYDAEMKKTLSDASNELRRVVKSFLCDIQYADYENLECLTSEDKDYITSKRYAKTVANNLILNGKATDAEYNSIEKRVNSTPLSDKEKQRIISGLHSDDYNVRLNSLQRIDRFYAGVFFTNYDGKRLLMPVNAGNQVINNYLVNNGIRADQLARFMSSTDTAELYSTPYGQRLREFITRTGSTPREAITADVRAFSGNSVVPLSNNGVLSSYILKLNSDYTKLKDDVLLTIKDSRYTEMVSSDQKKIIGELVLDNSEGYDINEVVFDPSVKLSDELLRELYKRYPKTNQYDPANQWENRLYVIRDYLTRTSTKTVSYTSKGTLVIVDLIDSYNMLTDKNISASTIKSGDTLDKYVKSEYLGRFAKSVKIRLKNTGDSYFDSKSNEIVIPRYYGKDTSGNYVPLDDKVVRANLVHEIQHVIQLQNGLNQGLDSRWLISGNKIKANERFMIKLHDDLERINPSIANSFQYYSPQFAKFMNDLIYYASGELSAYGFAGEIQHFIPYVVRRTRNGVSITSPTGTVFNIDNNGRMSSKDLKGFDEDKDHPIPLDEYTSGKLPKAGVDYPAVLRRVSVHTKSGKDLTGHVITINGENYFANENDYTDVYSLDRIETLKVLRPNVASYGYQRYLIENAGYKTKNVPLPEMLHLDKNVSKFAYSRENLESSGYESILQLYDEIRNSKEYEDFFNLIKVRNTYEYYKVDAAAENHRMEYYTKVGIPKIDVLAMEKNPFVQAWVRTAYGGSGSKYTNEYKQFLAKNAVGTSKKFFQAYLAMMMGIKAEDFDKLKNVKIPVLRSSNNTYNDLSQPLNSFLPISKKGLVERMAASVAKGRPNVGSSTVYVTYCTLDEIIASFDFDEKHSISEVLLPSSLMTDRTVDQYDGLLTGDVEVNEKDYPYVLFLKKVGNAVNINEVTAYNTDLSIKYVNKIDSLAYTNEYEYLVDTLLNNDVSFTPKDMSIFDSLLIDMYGQARKANRYSSAYFDNGVLIYRQGANLIVNATNRITNAQAEVIQNLAEKLAIATDYNPYMFSGNVIINFLGRQTFSHKCMDVETGEIFGLEKELESYKNTGLMSSKPIPPQKSVKTITQEEEEEAKKQKAKEKYRSAAKERYISNEDARGTNLSFYIQKGRPIMLSPKLANFIKDADPAQLESEIWDMIGGSNKGTLRTEKQLTQYLKAHLSPEAEQRINSYTLQMIAKHIYGTKINSYEDVDLFVSTAQDFYVLSSNLWDKENEVSKIPDTEVSIQAASKFALETNASPDYAKRLSRVTAHWDHVKDADGKWREINISNNDLALAFVMHFDGTIQSAVKAADIARKLAIHNHQRDVKLVQEGTTHITKKGTTYETGFENVEDTDVSAQIEAIESGTSREDWEDYIRNTLYDEYIPKWEAQGKSEAFIDRKCQELEFKLEKLSDKALFNQYVKLLRKKLEASKTSDVTEKEIEEAEKAPMIYGQRTNTRTKIKSNAIRIAKMIPTEGVKWFLQANGDIFNEDMKLKEEAYVNKSQEELDKLYDRLLDIKKKARANAYASKTRSQEWDKVVKKAARLEQQKEKQKSQVTKYKTLYKDALSKTKTRVYDMKGIAVSIDSETPMPASFKKIMETNLTTKYKTDIYNLSAADEQHTRQSLREFLVSNSETLDSLTVEEIDDILNFLEYYTMNPLENDEELVRRFSAFSIYTLSYISGQLGTTLNASKEQRIHAENVLKRLIGPEAGTKLAAYGSVVKYLKSQEAQEEVFKANSKKLGLTVSEPLVVDLVKAVRENNMPAMEKAMKAIRIQLEGEYTSRNRNIFDKLLKLQRAAMLSSPGTMVRNQVSNALVTAGNEVSDVIGKIFTSGLKRFSKFQNGSIVDGLLKNQYILTGTKVSDEIRQFIEINFKKNGLLALVQDGMNKYDVRGISRQSTDETVADLIIESIKNKIFSERSFGENKGLNSVVNKVISITMKGMSDSPWVNRKAVSYFGKMLAENEIRTGRSYHSEVTPEIYEIFADAYMMASFDYMHKTNPVVKSLEQAIRNQGAGAYFVYKQIFPFANASLNWAVEGLKYSPIGLARAVYNLFKLEGIEQNIDFRKQKGESIPSSKFTEFIVKRDLGKGIVGSVLWVLGAALAGFGLMRIDDEDEGLKLYFGNDVYLDINNIFGSSSLLAGAALVSTKYQEDHTFLDSVTLCLDEMFDEWFFTDLYNSFRFNQGIGEWLISQPSEALGRFVPNFIKGLSAMAYPYKVQYSSNTLLKPLERILIDAAPGIAYNFPAKVDPYTGELQSKYSLPFLFDFLGKFVGFKIQPYKVSSQEQEAIAVGVTRGVLTGNYKDLQELGVTLSSADIENLNKLYGKLNKRAISELLSNSKKYSVKTKDGTFKEMNYRQMTNEQKKSVINRIMDDNANKAKIYIATRKGLKYYTTSEERSELIKLGIRNVYVKLKNKDGFSN